MLLLVTKTVFIIIILFSSTSHFYFFPKIFVGTKDNINLRDFYSIYACHTPSPG